MTTSDLAGFRADDCDDGQLQDHARLLFSGEPVEREQAADRLADSGAEGIQALVTALDSTDWAAAAAAAWALSSRSIDETDAAALVKALRHPSAAVRSAAAFADLTATPEILACWIAIHAEKRLENADDALGDRILDGMLFLGEKADEALIAASHDQDSRVRSRAVFWARFRPSRPAYDIRLQAFDDQSAEVRLQAVQSLTLKPAIFITLWEAVRLVLRMIAVGAACGTALFALFAGIVSLLIGADAVGFTILIGLGAVVGSVAGIFAALIWMQPDESTTHRLPRHLANTAKDKLRSILNDPDPDVRAAALSKVHYLGRKGAPEVDSRYRSSGNLR